MNTRKVCPWCFGTFSIEDIHDQSACLERHKQVLQVERQFLAGRLTEEEFVARRSEAEKRVVDFILG